MSARTAARLGAAGATITAGAGLVVLAIEVAPRVEELATTSPGLVIALIALLAFSETGVPLLSVFVPAEFTVVLGGTFAATGALDLPSLLGAVWAASLAGDCVSYTAGRRLGRPFLHRPGGRLSLPQGRLEVVERMARRHGAYALLLARFLPVARALMPFVVGTTGLRPQQFVAVDVAATAAFTGAFVGAGYVGGQVLQTAPIALAGALVLTVATVVVRRRRASRTRVVTAESTQNPA